VKLRVFGLVLLLLLILTTSGCVPLKVDGISLNASRPPDYLPPGGWIGIPVGEPFPEAIFVYPAGSKILIFVGFNRAPDAVVPLQIAIVKKDGSFQLDLDSSGQSSNDRYYYWSTPPIPEPGNYDLSVHWDGEIVAGATFKLE